MGQEPCHVAVNGRTVRPTKVDPGQAIPRDDQVVGVEIPMADGRAPVRIVPKLPRKVLHLLKHLRLDSDQRDMCLLGQRSLGPVAPRATIDWRHRLGRGGVAAQPDGGGLHLPCSHFRLQRPEQIQKRRARRLFQHHDLTLCCQRQRRDSAMRAIGHMGVGACQLLPCGGKSLGFLGMQRQAEHGGLTVELPGKNRPPSGHQTQYLRRSTARQNRISR